MQARRTQPRERGRREGKPFGSAHGRPIKFPCPPHLFDVLPKDGALWRALHAAGETVAVLHSAHYLQTPPLESLALSEAGLGPCGLEGGAASPYIVKMRRDRYALQSESPLGVMRAFLEHRLGYLASPLKVWTVHSSLRSYSPREKQKHLSYCISYHFIGDSDPVYDVEAILSAFEYLRELSLDGAKLAVTTLGCRVCRSNYRTKLKAYYRERKQKLCARCERQCDENPIRLLRCEEPSCRELRGEAPIILDYLCQNCNNHLRAVLELIEDNGIVYEPDPYLIGDTDYYDRTIFEVSVPGSSRPVASGGRYDYLAEVIHDRMVPAVVSTIRLEAVQEALQAAGRVPERGKPRPKAFFIAVGEQAKKSSVRLMGELRAGGIIVAEAVGKKSLKAQLKAAEKSRAHLSMIVGQKEAFEDTVILRDMRTNAQETVVSSRIVEETKKRFR